MFQDQPRMRRLILIGTPLLTGILLLFHPLPESAEMGITELPTGLALYDLIAPIADGFLAVHLIFPLALALLGLSIFILRFLVFVHFAFCPNAHEIRYHRQTGVQPA